MIQKTNVGTIVLGTYTIGKVLPLLVTCQFRPAKTLALALRLCSRLSRNGNDNRARTCIGSNCAKLAPHKTKLIKPVHQGIWTIPKYVCLRRSCISGAEQDIRESTTMRPHHESSPSKDLRCAFGLGASVKDLAGIMRGASASLCHLIYESSEQCEHQIIQERFLSYPRYPGRMAYCLDPGWPIFTLNCLLPGPRKYRT